MNHIKIKNNLYLNCKEVELTKQQEEAAEQNLHIIKIIDRSGSMGYQIVSLVDAIKQFSLELRPDEKTTVGWFSGEGFSDFILKSFSITYENKSALNSILDQNKSTVNTTCFSEILNKVENLVKEPMYKNDKFVLYFFTDGYPVVSNYSKELSAIESVLSRLKDKLHYAAFVGCGNYYNRELLGNMAAQVGGSFIHLNAINDSYSSLTKFAESSRDSSAKVTVGVDGQFPFSISGKEIIQYAPIAGKIEYVPSKTNKNVVFYISDKPAQGSEEVTTLGDLQKGASTNKKDYLIKGIYSASIILSLRTKVAEALDMLGYIGDKNFIDKLNNARTNDEYGIVENEIKSAVFDVQGRGLAGFVPNYLPKDDAFCLLDLVDLLQKDEQAGFFPRHEGWEYSKVTVATEAKSDYPKFEADKNQMISFDKLVWNSTKLNLSIQAALKGHITLKEGHKKLGFASEYPCTAFRNYTIVKDGFPNVATLFADMSATTFNTLNTIPGLVEVFDSAQLGKKIYKLNLKAVPVMNRLIASKVKSAEPISRITLEETNLAYQQAVLNYLQKQNAEVLKEATSLNEKQEAFLLENGIKNGLYSPPVDKAEPIDFYEATEFNISIKGMASTPKAADVVSKVENKKPLTDREKPMADYYQLFKSSVGDQPKEVKRAWVEKNLEELKAKLHEKRRQVQEVKFGAILGKKWFEEFTSREEATYKFTEAGKEYLAEFKIKKVKVAV